MIDLESELNALKVKRSEASQQLADVEKLIDEIEQRDRALRKANRTGELAENHQKMQAARNEQRLAKNKAKQLRREIAMLANRIVDLEAQQHRQARDDVWRAWQSHPDAFKSWKDRRMFQLI